MAGDQLTALQPVYIQAEEEEGEALQIYIEYNYTHSENSWITDKLMHN